MILRNRKTAPCGAMRSCADCPSSYCPLRIKAAEEISVVSDFDYDPGSADGIAIDIGTTTIAAVKCISGKIAETMSEINKQHPWGTDVLSRIIAAENGAAKELHDTIRGQVDYIIRTLNGEGDNTVISGNMAMISLFMGWDCTELGRYPFKAYSTDTVRSGKLTIPGAVSAFIGGDITSGLYMCGFHESESVNMLIDLGTNGELAIGNKHRILCTSAAAGPAFEGGGISCGTGAVPGAIFMVSIPDDTIETIVGTEPRGICGSGLIELIYELVNNGFVDETGRLCDDFRDGYTVAQGITLTQKDIRELQLAKSAVRAGIEILIKEYGSCDIDNIYIAGGFGRYLDIKKACGIGLLPPRYINKYIAVGNSSLGGAVRILENGSAAIDRIRSVSEDFPLAEKSDFEELFLKYMDFSEG